MSKKKTETFVKQLCAQLIAIGATKVKDTINSFRSFELDTIVGKLSINVDTNSEYTYTMFACFENVAEAKKKFDCNPHSGKYNIHIGKRKDMTPARAVEICMIAIEATQPKRVEFKNIQVGETYTNVSHRFNNAKNRVTCIANDFTGMNRGIKYFCFTDRVSKVPTEKEFIAAMQDEATTVPKNYTKKQYDKACRMLEIRRNTFAMWSWEVDGIKGHAPSSSIFSL